MSPSNSHSLFQTYFETVEDSLSKEWRAFLTEECEQRDMLHSLISNAPMLETKLNKLLSSTIMANGWSVTKRHKRISLLNDWIYYCQVMGETELGVKVATTPLTRPRNPASPEEAAVALRLYNALRKTLYDPPPSGKAYSSDAQVGRALLSGILFGGLLSERSIWALLRVISNKPTNLGGLPTYSLTLSRNGVPEAEVRHWVPDALTGVLIGNLHINQVDLNSLLPEKPKSGFIMTLIQSWIRESSDLNMLSIVNRAQRPGTPASNGAERNTRKRVTLKYLLELTRIVYGPSIPNMVIDYFSGLTPSHSLPLPRLQLTQARAGTACEAGSNGESETELSSVLDQTAASLAGGSSVSDQSIQVGLSPAPTLLPTVKSLGYDQWTLERFSSLLQHHLAGIKPGSPMASMLLKWSKESMKSGRNDKSHHQLDQFRQFFNRCYRLLQATDTNVDITTVEAEWFDGVYGELLDDYPDNQKRHVAKFLSRFHDYLVEHHGAAQLQTSKTFQDKRRRPTVHADIITLDEFSAFKNVLLNEGSSVGNQVFLTLNDRHPDLPKVVTLISVLGYRCGLRRREALHLRLCDVHGPNQICVLVRPHKLRRLKTTSSQRQTPCWALLEPDELELLIGWTQHRLQVTGGDLHQPLFSIPEINPGAVSEDMVFPCIHRILRAITGRPEHRFHLFRHSFASLLILKLTAGDSKAAQSWFSHYPKTLKWLSEDRELRQKLVNTPDATRKLLFAVSSLLGHSAPNVSLEHYIHVLDIIGTAEILDWRKHPRSVLINATALPMPTARRALQKSWTGFVLRHWSKPTKASAPPLIWSPANAKLAADDDTLSEWPSLGQVARAASEVVKFKDSIGIDRLERTYGWSAARANGFIVNAQSLFGLHPETDTVCPAAYSPEVDYVRKTSPSAYRTSVEWKLNDQCTLWLFERLILLAQTDPSTFSRMINTYTRLSHKDYFHVILKTEQDIRFYFDLVNSLNISKSKISFAHLVGKRSSKGWIDPGKRAWRDKLGLNKNTAFKRFNINNSITVGEHGWVGVKVLKNFSQVGTSGKGNPRASQMFPFVMNSMVLGKGVFW